MLCLLFIDMLTKRKRYTTLNSFLKDIDWANEQGNYVSIEKVEIIPFDRANIINSYKHSTLSAFFFTQKKILFLLILNLNFVCEVTYAYGNDLIRFLPFTDNQNGRQLATNNVQARAKNKGVQYNK